MVSNNDLNELRRMFTNSYDDDKALINRVLRGINELTAENLKMKAELKVLKEGKHVDATATHANRGT